MTRTWLIFWHFQSRITLWCRHKSTNVSMGLCWQMSKFIVWRLWYIYFDHHLPLKPSIRKRRKQSCNLIIQIIRLIINVFEIQNTKHFHNLLSLILKLKIQNTFILSYEIQNTKFFFSYTPNKHNVYKI